MKIIGFNNYSFDDKNTGNRIEGVTFHCAVPINPKNGMGDSSFKFSVSKARYNVVMPAEPEDMLNKEISVMYNQFRSVERVELK